MSQEYDNTNRGAAWPNKRKAKPTHADYGGELNVEGKEFWLNIWVKKKQDGSMSLSVSIKPKAPRIEARPHSHDLGDDIPF